MRLHYNLKSLRFAGRPTLISSMMSVHTLGRFHAEWASTKKSVRATMMLQSQLTTIVYLDKSTTQKPNYRWQSSTKAWETTISAKPTATES